MSYMTDKFKAGEVVIRDHVCGWYFKETNEHRPLMGDAMAELLEAGLVTQEHVEETAIARDAHVIIALATYAQNQEEFWSSPETRDAQLEQLSEMQAAFGEGQEVVNMITGRKHQL